MERKISLKKNAILNIIKQVLSIAFPLITFPYVSRILLETNLGKYNFSLSVVSYFSLIAGLGIRSYGIREGARVRDNHNKCNELANQIFTINLYTTIFAYLLLMLTIILWKKLHNYILLLIIQSLTMIFTTLGADWINGIYEDYEYMTKRYIVVKCISLVCIFAFVKNINDYILYAGIITGSDILANIFNIFYIRRYVKLKLVKDCRFQFHIVPLLILFANSLAITIYSNADITMLGIFKGDSQVGIYSVSSKVYQIAKLLINAIIVVVIPRLASLLGEENTVAYNSLLKRALKSILVFMFPLITGIYMLSAECVLLLGGRNFISGEIALKILSFALIPAALSSVFFDGVLIVNRKEKYCLLSTLISAVFNVVLNLFFIPHYGINGAAITTLIAEMVGCSLAIYYAKDCHNVHLAIDKDFLSIIIGCSLIAACCYLLNGLDGLMIRVALSVTFSGVLYSLTLLIMGNSTFRGAFLTFKHKLNKKMDDK